MSHKLIFLKGKWCIFSGTLKGEKGRAITVVAVSGCYKVATVDLCIIHMRGLWGCASTPIAQNYKVSLTQHNNSCLSIYLSRCKPSLTVICMPLCTIRQQRNDINMWHDDHIFHQVNLAPFLPRKDLDISVSSAPLPTDCSAKWWFCHGNTPALWISYTMPRLISMTTLSKI